MQEREGSRRQSAHDDLYTTYEGKKPGEAANK